jgi:hypothetical protein
VTTAVDGMQVATFPLRRPASMQARRGPSSAATLAQPPKVNTPGGSRKFPVARLRTGVGTEKFKKRDFRVSLGMFALAVPHTRTAKARCGRGRLNSPMDTTRQRIKHGGMCNAARPIFEKRGPKKEGVC